MPETIASQDIVAWLAGEDCYCLDEAGMVEQLGTRLRLQDIPLDCLVLHLRTLHPELLGRTVTWAPGEPALVQKREYGIEVSPHFVGTPVWQAMESHETVVARPDDIGGHWTQLDVFKGRQLSELMVVPLPNSQGLLNAVSFATRRASGFSLIEREALNQIVPALRNVTELHSLRLMERALLDTYVGRLSAERVMSGRIRRGEVESLEAALFLCDLRDFTRVSNRLPAEQVLGLLNSYFDKVIPAIGANGGEVLKIMGDAVLAFFHRDSAKDACVAALSGAHQALEGLADAKPSPADLSAGIALHFGTVSYGNIGSGSRLDFTAIGPDVNLVSRIQSVCSSTRNALLMSDRFSKALGRTDTVSIGKHDLKGFAHPVELYALKHLR